MGVRTSMLGNPAGWYQDPAAPNPDAPDRLRFWDGTAWTADVKMASKKERQQWAAEAAAARQVEARRIREAAAAGDPEARAILVAALQSQGTRSSTPDGQQLAGWWRRVAAYVIDSVLASLLGLVFSWNWLREIFSAYNSYVEAFVSASQRGTPPPDPAELTAAVAGPMLGVALVATVVVFVYEVGFLKAFQATPGKMVLGMEVRLREQPGPMSWGTVLLRWLTKSGVGLLNLLPLGQLLAGLYGCVDGLWPLWDSKRQALHDKAARTNVVRR